MLTRAISMWESKLLVLSRDVEQDEALIRQWTVAGWMLVVVVRWRDEWHAFLMRWIDTPDDQTDRPS